MPEREFNGPGRGAPGALPGGAGRAGRRTSPTWTARSSDAACATDEDFSELLYEHCCEGMYGAPEYGGNRDGVGWDSIEYEGDVQPRGYSDAEVSQP